MVNCFLVHSFPVIFDGDLEICQLLKGYSNSCPFRIMCNRINKQISKSPLKKFRIDFHIKLSFNCFKRKVIAICPRSTGYISYSTENKDVVELVRRTVADVASAPWANGYHLSFETVETQLDMQIDPKLFQRALRNLLVNSVTHNPKGTRIRVTLQKLTDLKITIEDNGKGMDKETIDRKSTRLNSSHVAISYAVFCLKKKK